MYNSASTDSAGLIFYTKIPPYKGPAVMRCISMNVEELVKARVHGMKLELQLQFYKYPVNHKKTTCICRVGEGTKESCDAAHCPHGCYRKFLFVQKVGYVSIESGCRARKPIYAVDTRRVKSRLPALSDIESRSTTRFLLPYILDSTITALFLQQ
jgi:hypothetical protein